MPVRKQRDSETASSVQRNFSIKRCALRRKVRTDREKGYVPERMRKIAKSDQLPDAVWSPVTAIENENDPAATGRGKSD